MFRAGQTKIGLTFVATVVVALIVSFTGQVWAESVAVKYDGLVDLKPFECQNITRSSFIQRVCYDRSNQYMLINLNGTYYHYCAIDPQTVLALQTAESIGRFFNANIKGRFDCRINPIPVYR
jgi:hypothetical protein